jgi:hypothetical protein
LELGKVRIKILTKRLERERAGVAEMMSWLWCWYYVGVISPVN